MTDAVWLESAPLIPDLTFRRFRGARDLIGIAALHRTRVEHDRLDPLTPGQQPPTVPALAEIYRTRLDFDPERQMLMAEVRGRLVGYAWIRSWAQADGAWVLYHRLLLHPPWRGKGIGGALTRWAETTLRDIARRRPLGTTAILRSDAYSTERETVARLEAFGYHVDHDDVELAMYSLAELQAPFVPDGYEIRAPHPDEYRPAYFDMEAAFVDEWGYVDKFEDDFAALMNAPVTDPTLWRIAVDGEQIAGVVMCEAHPPVGMVQDLAVGAGWRRRGLGRALLLAGLHALRERGMTQARIYTDANDPHGALRLYQSVGFQVVKSIRRYVKPLVNSAV